MVVVLPTIVSNSEVPTGGTTRSDYEHERLGAKGCRVYTSYRRPPVAPVHALGAWPES